LVKNGKSKFSSLYLLVTWKSAIWPMNR